MDHFKEAFTKTMSEEGGYNFDRMDPGGETYMGISRVYWPSWEGWVIIDKYEEKGIVPKFPRTGLVRDRSGRITRCSEACVWQPF